MSGGGAGGRAAGGPAIRWELSLPGAPRRLRIRALRAAAEELLARERVTEGILSVALAGDGRMARLHRRYRGASGTTDVLAFDLSPRRTRRGRRLVADIYVSRERARRQARRWGAPADEEIVRLVCHGLLHCLGYDHGAREWGPLWERQERAVARYRARARGRAP